MKAYCLSLNVELTHTQRLDIIATRIPWHGAVSQFSLQYS